MTLDSWQVELRRQFGAEQDFRIENTGDEPVFSEFRIINPKKKREYRVAIRGEALGVNYCSCPDFATNTLGTCKHVEFTLARLRRKRGAKKAFKEGHQPPYSEVYLLYGAEREVRFRPGSECPVELARLAARYFDAEGKLKQRGFQKFDAFLTQVRKIDHELRVYDDVLDFVAEIRDAQRRREVLAKAFPRGRRSAAWKNLVALPLFDYQRDGALFAARAGRCLIGDEMGLGKTFQAIAATEIMARHFGVERVLIICPASLKHQWEREIDRLTDRPTEVIGGQRLTREKQFAAESFYKITNYDTVHRDLGLIQHWSPDLVILDEAQRIKNWETRAARSVKQISSPYCIVLTGTPLENRLQELVSIVDFVDRHRLGPTFRFLDKHQVCEEGTTKVVGYRHLDEIGKTLEPILIRRRKDEVLSQLPERLEKRFFVPMTPQQQRHHEENKETVARIVAKWRHYGFLSEQDQLRLMICLQNMRMSCNSTYLLDKKTDFGTKADELVTLLEEIYESPDNKVVIFSQWVRTHELLIRRFEPRGWDHALFHGGVATSKRKGLIDRFREEPDCRSFLSTDAGGVGLNLQHANFVINMDMPWNPAILEQRIGRVHRLGQTQPVRVVNFVAKGTIEEGMLALLGFKKSLFSGVLDGGQKEVFLGKTRLKRFMETVEKATGAIPGPEPPTPADEPAPREDKPDDELLMELAAMPPDVAREPSAADSARPSPAPTSDEAAGADPLTGLIQNGLALLEQFANAKQGTTPATKGRQARQADPIQVVRDDQDAEPYLKIRMPAPEVVDQALSAIKKLVDSLR